MCGLSAAIALSRVGHKVTVFDVTNPFEPVRTSSISASHSSIASAPHASHRPLRTEAAGSRRTRRRCTTGGGWRSVCASAAFIPTEPCSLRVSAVTSVCLRLLTCLRSLCVAVDSGAVVDSQEWEEDVMEETGGDFLLIHVRLASCVLL